MSLQIINADCRVGLKDIPDGSVQCCVTSPPYYNQRAYLRANHPLKHLEIGQEKTVAEYVRTLVAVFGDVHRRLHSSGTLWVVIDDKIIKGQPAGAPWRFVFAMQDFGWRFITEIIWNKPNPTPQSVKKKPTRSHEYVFLFAKVQDYYYDQDAIRTPYAPSTIPRQLRGVSNCHKYVNGAPGQTPHSLSRPRLNMREVYAGEATKDYTTNGAQNPSATKRRVLASLLKHSGANKKTVWTVTKKAYRGAHFATYPMDLIEPCILAGSRAGDTVLDPFGGTGTTARAALKHNRHAIVCELNEEYVPLIEQRTNVTPGLAMA